MAANLITSNTGEGIVIKRECSQQFSRYCTSIFSNTMEIYYGKPFDRNIYVHSQKHFQNYKTCSKLLTLMLRWCCPNFDTSSSVKPIKHYMLQYLVGIHFKGQPSRSRFLPILQQFDLKCNRTITELYKYFTLLNNITPWTSHVVRTNYSKQRQMSKAPFLPFFLRAVSMPFSLQCQNNKILRRSINTVSNKKNYELIANV